MPPISQLLRKLRSIARPRAAKREIDEELRFHLEQRAAESLAAGMSSEDAAREARKRFGNVQSVREACRERRGASFGEATWMDLRLTFRQLLRNPGFTAVAVLTLALGIGVNTAIFGMLNAVLLRPLPYPEPDRLVRIASVNPQLGVSDSRSSHPNVLDWRERSGLFEEIATFQEWDGALTVEGRSESVRVNWVTPNLLPMLGVHPLHGRLLEDGDMDSGILLPHGVWHRLLGGDAAAIGRRIQCDGEWGTIVGILPPNVSVPVQGSAPPDQVFLSADIRRTVFPRDLQLHNVVGRLKPGVTVSQAQEDLNRVAAELEHAFPETNRGWGVKVSGLKEWGTRAVRPALLAVYGATGIILLITCLNVSNLLLIRLESRRTELAIRSALGSSRLRLIRQVFGESLCLSLFGAAAGLLAALGCRGAVLGFLPDSLGIRPEAVFDPAVLLSAAAVTLVAALLSGAFPALRLNRSHLARTLGESGRSASPGQGRHRLLNGLVAGQIAVSTVLLVAAGLAIFSFRNLMDVDPGFSKHNTVSFRVDPYPNGALTRRVIEAVSALPGVESVGGANHALLDDLWSNGVRITVDGPPGLPTEAAPTVDFWRVTTGYFPTAGIPLIAGRSFDAQDPYDDETNRLARVIINQALARQFFRDHNPVGRFIRILPREGVGAPSEIIGIVGAIKHRGLHRDDVPILYWHSREASTLVVRTSANPVAQLPAMREAIRRVDPELIVSHVFTTEQIIARALADRRLATLLMFAFGGLGTGLAALGLYGVTSYAVGQRSREIGVRMALGAQRGDVLRLVMAQGMRVGGVGILAGLLGALGASHAIQHLLFNVNPLDPVTYGSVSLLLLLVAILASWLPARWATRIDPMEALRCE